MGFKGCLLPQDLSVPWRVCFWYISDFALIYCSLFSIYMYILKYGSGSLIYVLVSQNGWSMILWSEYWFLEMGLIVFVIGIIFIFQVLVFVTIEINGFLIFGNGVCLFLTLLSYIPSIYFIIKLLLRSISSWILAFIQKNVEPKQVEKMGKFNNNKIQTL